MELAKPDAAQMILSVHAYTPNTPHKTLTQTCRHT